MRTRLGAARLLAAAFGGCAETIGDPYVAPGKFRFLRCPDIAARQDTADARHKELLALMERSGVDAVNTFVYGPDLNNVEAELRALQQTAAATARPSVDLQWWMPILGGVTAVYAFWLVRFGPGD